MSSLAYIINTDALAAITDKKIISADEYQTILGLHNASDIIQNEVSKRLAKVEDELRLAKEAGYRDGMALANQKMAESLTHTALKAQDVANKLQANLVDAVVEAVTAIVGASNRDALLTNTLRRLGRTMRNARYITLRVPLAQHAKANKAIKRVFEEIGAAPAIEIIADPSLQEGSCIMESEAGSAEANLQSHLLAIRAALLSRVKHEVQQLWDDQEE